MWPFSRSVIVDDGGPSVLDGHLCRREEAVHLAVADDESNRGRLGAVRGTGLASFAECVQGFLHSVRRGVLSLT